MRPQIDPILFTTCLEAMKEGHTAIAWGKAHAKGIKSLGLSEKEFRKAIKALAEEVYDAEFLFLGLM